MKDIITGLKLNEYDSAWGVWQVEVENMRGAEKGNCVRFIFMIYFDKITQNI